MTRTGDQPPRRFRQVRDHLMRTTTRAISDFRMIEDGDTVMVCLSGGKDSHSMLSILRELQAHAPIRFRLIAMNLDQKQPGFPADALPAYLRDIGVDFRIVEADTYAIVKRKIPEGRTTCSLCSRLRRGIIYRTARELGATKIALGHHRDDLVETLFLNMFFGGRMKAMAPRLRSDDGRHVVIRPLAYCNERDIATYARYMRFPIIPCDLCGSQENLQRKRIKTMLQAWEEESPGRVENIFRAMTRVVPSHLADRTLFDFQRGTSGADGADPETLFDADAAGGMPGLTGTHDSASAAGPEAPIRLFARTRAGAAATEPPSSREPVEGRGEVAP